MGGVLRLPKNNLNLPEESFRLQIKDLAEETRIKFARKGLSDIFGILSEAAFLVRKPLDTDELSGFSTYFEEQFIVYLNSNFTLGHERYTGAHELYHLIYNADILKKEKILLDDEKHKAEEQNTNLAGLVIHNLKRHIFQEDENFYFFSFFSYKNLK